MQLSFITFNIHKGFNWNNSNFTLAYLREALTKLDPDIVFLQEVVGENQTLEKELDNWINDHAKFLAQEIWPHQFFSKHATFDHRNHGNLILSKYPISHTNIVDLSLSPLEQRALLHAEINIDGQNLQTYCTHLNLLHRDRKNQYRKIKDYISSIDSKSEDPIILAGDFNDWNQKASQTLLDISDLKEAHKSIHGYYAKTFPAFLPFFKLDRIYTKGLSITETEVLTHQDWSTISDHLPILVRASL